MKKLAENKLKKLHELKIPVEISIEEDGGMIIYLNHKIMDICYGPANWERLWFYLSALEDYYTELEWR